MSAEKPDPRSAQLGEGEHGALERRLLDAAQREVIPPALKLRMEQALQPAPVGAGTGTLRSLASSKAGTLIVVSALGLGGALGLRSPVREDSRTDRTAPSAPETRGAPATGSGPNARSDTFSGASTAALAREVALLDRAREALRARQSAQALSELARHTREFPHGMLTPEATVLRIEALVQSGAAQEARLLARSFLVAHPESPLVERVRQIAMTQRAR